MRIGMCLVCLRKGLLPFDMCLVCLQKSIGTLFSDPLSSFLSLMKEKKAKENQGDDRLLFFRVLDRWNESLLPFGMCLVCLQKSMGALSSDPLSSFLSLMKEKKAKENQGDDRLLFFRVLNRWNESVLPFGGILDRWNEWVLPFDGMRFFGRWGCMSFCLSLFFGR